MRTCSCMNLSRFSLYYHWGGEIKSSFSQPCQNPLSIYQMSTQGHITHEHPLVSKEQTWNDVIQSTSGVIRHAERIETVGLFHGSWIASCLTPKCFSWNICLYENECRSCSFQVNMGPNKNTFSSMWYTRHKCNQIWGWDLIDQDVYTQKLFVHFITT